MSKLTILRGCSGSGKSTFARAQENAVVVCRDDLRAALFGSDGPEYYNVGKDVLRSREDYITKVEHMAIREGLKSGQDVVVDSTHIMARYVNAVARIGWSEGAEVEVKTFDVPLYDALARNRWRAGQGGRNVPEDVIKRQYEHLAKSNIVLTPPPPVIPYSGTEDKPDAFIVDLDGSLSHMNGRRGPFDWDKVGLDSVDEVVARVVRELGESLEIVVMSGRDSVSRDGTVEWLKRHDIQYDELIMRAEKDMRADNIVKAELFDNHVRDNHNIRFVIDDRWQVCQMWLSMGLKVFNVSGLDRGEF